MPTTEPHICACTLAWNEERQLADALATVAWTDQQVVIDNESSDATIAVARRCGAEILTAPRASNFDAARNLVIPHMRGDWLWVLDADERVPPRLGPIVRDLVRERGHEFAGVCFPFKHYFCGRWMRHSGWWPGYKGPQLLKKGCFRFNERLHSGVSVDGPLLRFPADDPDLAIEHFSYADLTQYLEKLNRYTTGEAENLHADGLGHSWQSMLAHFVQDWQGYYEQGRADLDDMEGFELAFLSGVYRFVARGKLRDLRRRRGELPEHEPVPADLREMLEFMARVCQQGAAPWISAPAPPLQHARPSPADQPAGRVAVLFRSPLFDPSGYADGARNLALALIEAGEALGLAPERWGDADAGVPPEHRARLEERIVAADTPVDVCIHYTLLPLQQRFPTARCNIARTMFETDRLPEGAAARLNAMDRVWVPSEFNRETFVRSGVDPNKIAVIPEAIDPGLWQAPSSSPATPARPGENKPLRPNRKTQKELKSPNAAVPASLSSTVNVRRETLPNWPLPDGAYVFLSVFDWTLHKGWDVLLEAFAREFAPSEAPTSPGPNRRSSASIGGSNPVHLLIKTWSSRHYTLNDIRAQADALLQNRLGRPLSDFPNVHFWQENLPAGELPALYRAVDAFVLPTRGEGWCRPLMEAMASALPTIATAWSGLTAFHNDRVGYPLRYRLLPVSPEGAREIPEYAGHCWAEPDLDDLRRRMRRLVADPDAGRRRGLAAQKYISRHYSRPAVARLMQTELAGCREQIHAGPVVEQHPVLPSAADQQLHPAAAEPHRRAPGKPAGPSSRLATKTPDPLAGSAPAHRPPANPVPIDPLIPVDFAGRLGRPLRVRWEGDQSILSSLALVNRELCLGLLAEGDVEISLQEARTPWHQLDANSDPRLPALFARLSAPLSGPPDVTIRHFFPPNWTRPPQGKLVVMQPWEYGHLPRDWVEGAAKCADEIWVYSRFVRDVYVRSGVPAEKIRVIPLGINSAVFSPDGPRFKLPFRSGNPPAVSGPVGDTGAPGPPTVFLFVGGTLHRKGADLLLQAYLRAFRRDENVCLVIKDLGSRTFYAGQNFGDDFRAAAQDTSGPQVLYLDGDLADDQLAALYRAADCLVLPYRCEGFALPPLEAMACGRAAIVTAGGPTEDYADDSIALRVPARRRPHPTDQIGPFACVANPWHLEPDLDALVDAFHWVRDHPKETRQRGHAASARAIAGWTWARSVGVARNRLATLVASAPPRALAAPTFVGEPPAPKRQARRAAERRAARLGSAAVELSVCIIVRNEAPRLAACLNSIRPYVDEMIVLDTGSTDETREIALACGARVYQMEWSDSFAEARNWSIELARGRWVFWMDADDVISPECGAALRHLIRDHPNRDAAFHVQVRIPPGPGQFSESVVDHVKLFPNRQEFRFEHRIHEQILPSLRRAGMPVHFSDLFVTHAHYDHSPEGQALKRIRDFHLLELDLRDHPDHPFVLYNLGMTHLYATQDYEVAAHYLRRSLDGSHPQDSIVRKAWAMLATAYACQLDWDAAVSSVEQGLRVYPQDPELLFLAAQNYQQVGQPEAARSALGRLLDGHDDPHYRSVDTGLRTYRGLHELARLCARTGERSRAIQILRDVVERNPSYVPAHVDLVERFIDTGQLSAAREALGRLPALASIADDKERLEAMIGPAPVAAEIPLPTVAPSGGHVRPGGGWMEPQWSAAPRFGRRSTVLRALQQLHALCPGPSRIVETGTIRDVRPEACNGDGWSTVAWGWYAVQTGGRAYTVDFSADSLALCRGLTSEYAGSLEYVHADSLDFLARWAVDAPGSIDFLYLDSLDYFDQGASEAHSLAEVTAALPALAPTALVLFDDTRPMATENGGFQHRLEGQGSRAVPYLCANGFHVAWADDGQVLMVRKVACGTA